MGCGCIGPTKDKYSIENILGEKIQEPKDITSKYIITEYVKKVFNLINRIRVNPPEFVNVIETAEKYIKDNNGRKKIKYITDSKLKHKCFEELKIRINYKPNKKSLVEPIRAQFMNSLQKKVGFIFEDYKRNFYKNKAISKLSLVKKMKSKSKKDCTEYVDNFDDELFYKNKNGSYNLKDKNITSFHSKKIDNK